MSETRLRQIERQLQTVKEQLQQLGEMRPGTLTMQYKNPKEKKGAFYQLSYTHKTKSKTEYVRQQHLADVWKQLKTYKKFKSLVEKWVDLSLEYSKLKMQLTNNDPSN